ncbi:hypothetical protein GCM10010123_29510 [Pilimelia anulata]|uniref:Peptidase M28 domain-containing protein n=1 Tax=Pilimelia anulata TaxID=53371 RepID=A0A8J3B5T9_9ACTN|nr:M28 family peptidase [Pilimelia anulata]GGJ97606.1 hypothetical protein GCM10010123_29510 [Pilimelia anulata]
MRRSAVPMAIALLLTGAAAPAAARPAPADIPTITLESLRAHLATFARITAENGGHRLTGSPGEVALRQHVAGALRAAGYEVSTQGCPPKCKGVNLFADSTGGDPQRLYLFGAHLDSVSTTPGLNDNAAAVATVLETALVLAERKPALAARVRFAFWGDEEPGMVGSLHYVRGLDAAARARIKGYLNFEMVGSPNGGYFVNNPATPLGTLFREYYDARGVPVEESVELARRSDNVGFDTAGLPATGVNGGAGAKKTEAQAGKWGGTAGQPYDGCYHRACDTAANVDPVALTHAANAQLTALYKLAVAR